MTAEPDPAPESPDAGEWWARVKRSALPQGAAHWGWWAGGLGAGLLVALLATTLSGQRTPAAPPPGSRAEIEAIVRETILANPELIPEAINRLQEREVEKLLASNREAIETPFAGAWAGAKDGDVVLVEFFDFNCPYCRKSAEDVDRLLKEDPKLKVVFRDMPVLGPDSEHFAMASLSAAQQGRYRKFYSTVFAGQGALNQERLIRSVRQAGLDEGKVANDLQSKALQAEIEKNMGLGRALGLTGTPSYVVGNRILSGAVGYDELKLAVEQAREKQGADRA
ncbi:DsbA family protein [Sandaracinobacter sp. RS1-74]|uniref:DsbA family protein n=1 Tax=Sandaracinobacteroides sayramensis TaxID=2913411 RepID=UPI001EDC057B|nr:DsbA family protein [Sandaracinobacteroides sayramensis]MCG2839680.1 DsbA family protein [Sandaracinobacteroides sayramensis]